MRLFQMSLKGSMRCLEGWQVLSFIRRLTLNLESLTNSRLVFQDAMSKWGSLLRVPEYPDTAASQPRFRNLAVHYICSMSTHIHVSRRRCAIPYLNIG